MATFGSCVSYILQKKGFIKVENTGLNGVKRKNPLNTCEWKTGIFLTAVSSILHVVVLPFLDLVVIESGAAFAILFNSILAVYYLDEKVIWCYDLPAFSLIIGGSLCIVLLSDFSENSFTPDKIKSLLFSWSTLGFMAFYSATTFAAAVQYRWHSRQIEKFNKDTNTWLDLKLTQMLSSDTEIKYTSLAETLIE